ncbi:MAG: sialidase family protein [Acidimicrobiales bacterium]
MRPRVVIALVGALGVLGVLWLYVAAGAEPREQPRLGLEVPVTATALGVGPANNTPVLAADPADPRFVVLANRLDAPDFGCALQVSGNGGRGWLSVNAVPELPEGAEKCYGPEVAFDAKGTLYYLFVGLAGGGNQPMGAFLTKSLDRGQTFSRAQRVLGPLEFGVRMGIDRSSGKAGRLHLVWLHATSIPSTGSFGPPPNPIMSAYSDDGGNTFSAPVQVSDPARQRVVAPALALGPGHAVHVAYYDLQDDAVDYQGLEGNVSEQPWTLVLASSSDGGRSFSPGSVIDDAILPAERVLLVFTMPPPALTVHEEGVCAAWTDARNGDADVLVRCSGDRGRSWEPVRRANDDNVGNGRGQYMPALSASPAGQLNVVFFDRRDDPQNLRTTLYYASSDDWGRSFAGNVRLSTESFDPRIGQRYVHPSADGLVEFGSRLAVLSTADFVLAAWPDTRNQRSTMTGQDLFARRVELRAGGGGRMSKALGGALVVLPLMTGAAFLFRRRWLSRPGSAALSSDGG